MYSGCLARRSKAMESKIIKFPTSGSTDRADYILRLRELSQQLQAIACGFKKDARVVLADLTYLIVWDDIMDTMQSDDSVTERLREVTTERADSYLQGICNSCGALQQVALFFSEEVRSVLADLTYIVVGDDILSTVEAAKL